MSEPAIMGYGGINMKLKINTETLLGVERIKELNLVRDGGSIKVRDEEGYALIEFKVENDKLVFCRFGDVGAEAGVKIDKRGRIVEVEN